MILEVDEGLILRELEPEEVSEKYLGWMTDEEVVGQTEQRFQEQTLNGIRGFVREKKESKDSILFGIFCDGDHVGNIKIGPINWNHLTADISYFVGEKNMWGKGLATRSVRAVSEFAFWELGLKKLNAGYYSTNIASALVLEKTNFQLEGIRRSQFIYKGRRISAFEVGLVESDIS